MTHSVFFGHEPVLYHLDRGKALSSAAIHRSSWNSNSPNFRFTAFSEVRSPLDFVTFAVTLGRRSSCRVVL